MASKKKQTKQAGDPADQAYEDMLAAFAKAVETFGKGDFAGARDALSALVRDNPDEIELGARARSYLAACERRLEEAPSSPETADDHFYLGVVALNDRRLDEAVASLDRALAIDPSSSKAWYARASVRAVQGNAPAAVDDLRKAVDLDPTLRFQAINDLDFESVRDDAAFIDIVEPTPSEA